MLAGRKLAGRRALSFRHMTSQHLMSRPPAPTGVLRRGQARRSSGPQQEPRPRPPEVNSAGPHPPPTRFASLIAGSRPLALLVFALVGTLARSAAAQFAVPPDDPPREPPRDGGVIATDQEYGRDYPLLPRTTVRLYVGPALR